MKRSFLFAAFYCAIASLMSGCGSAPSGKALLGTYEVMIAAMGKSDPDVMTVSQGANGTLLLTFEAGITTDAGGPDPDGLRATIMSSTMLNIAAQPAHIDHSTGPVDCMLSGDGTIGGDGSVDLTLHALITGTTVPQDYAVTGTRM